MILRLFVRLVPLILLFSAPARAQLSPAEQQMTAFIEAHNDDALALLETTVNVNSGTMNFDGVREVGRLLRPEFDGLGFQTRWIDGEAWGRAGHLLAERPGGDLHVLLIGHLDTVFELDSPFQRLERIDEFTARGPGIADMKGGNVVMIQALRALHDAGALDDLTVTAILIGDEEKSGSPLSLARADLIEAARAADVALGFEPGDGSPETAVVARRGWTGWHLRVRAQPAHSSRIFREETGAGAVFEAARILQTFYDALRPEMYLTFNPGVILGGTDVDFDPEEDRGVAFGKLNVIAEHAVVSGDLRTLFVEQRERTIDRMKDVVARSLPHTVSEIRFDEGYPPMSPTEGNHRLLGIYDELSRDLGTGPVSAVDPQLAGAADIAFAADHVDMALDGLGLMGAGIHTPEETADLRTLPTQAQRAALLLYRLARMEATP